MIKATLEDLAQYTTEENYLLEGYGEIIDGIKYVHVEKSLCPEYQRLTAIHEVLELNFPHVAHHKIDQASIDCIDSLIQLGFTQ